MAFLCIAFALLMMMNNPCLSVFTTGKSKLPRAGNEFAVAYDSSTSTILIFGGAPNSAQFVTFKDHTFTDEDEQYLTSEQTTGGMSQHYTQLGDELWMIQSSGATFVKANTKTHTITIPSTRFPTTVNDGACLAATNAYLFVIGGGTGNLAMKTTQIYDINDGQWVQDVPSLNTQRSSLSCIVYENILFAIGGDDGTYRFLDSIETLDTISTTAWVTDRVQALKSPRKAAQSVIYGTDIYVIGGKDNNGNRVADINVIDTFTGTVSPGDTLDYATSYAAPIIVGNTLYVFGGYLSSGMVDTYQYSILPTSPTKHPSAAPTSPPSDNPTLLPTNTPTAPPSFMPTLFPSNVPILPPSNIPTLTPSGNPTQRASTPSISALISPMISVTDNEAEATSINTMVTNNEAASGTPFFVSILDMIIISVVIGVMVVVCGALLYCYAGKVVKLNSSKTLEQHVGKQNENTVCDGSDATARGTRRGTNELPEGNDIDRKHSRKQQQNKAVSLAKMNSFSVSKRQQNINPEGHNLAIVTETHDGYIYNIAEDEFVIQSNSLDTKYHTKIQ
eukprot:330189_1